MQEAQPVEVIPPQKLSRAEIKERCRLAYISGRRQLVELAEIHGIKYFTLQRWSKEEGWGKQRIEIVSLADRKSTQDMASWMAEEQMGQVKTGVERARMLRQLGNLAAYDSNGKLKKLDPKDLQALANSEDRADTIARRNLGLHEAGAGTTVNVNVLSHLELG